MNVRFKQLAIGAATGVAALFFLGLPTESKAQDAETIYQLQALLEEVRELRGQVEAQQVEIENLRRRQRDQYLDLDQRLQAVGRQASSSEPIEDDLSPMVPESTDSASGSAGGSTNRPTDDSTGEMGQAIGDRPEVRPAINTVAEVITLTPPASGGERGLEQASEQEQSAYDQAFRALREARYGDAAVQFNAFVDRYPNSTYAPNAYYWLAETYYVTRDFETARSLFANVLERFPDSSKAGDALLKLGFSHFELQQWTEARSALEQVRAQYPDTTLSRLAESRLRDMRLSGRF